HPSMTIAHNPEDYLRSLPSIRDRCQLVYEKGQKNELQHFNINSEKLPVVVDYVKDVITKKYDSLDKIPPHSRWRHFDAGGYSRVQDLIDEWKNAGVDATERTRRLVDLFLVAVLLDAGAGMQWKYKDEVTGQVYRRSEGLGVASYNMFKAGLFSDDPTEQPHRVDVDRLQRLRTEDVSNGFQVHDDNPMVGINGRANLLNRLGRSIEQQSTYFPTAKDAVARPGNLLDYLLSHNSSENDTGKHIFHVPALWSGIMSLGEMWPARLKLNGVQLGDVWPCLAIKSPSAPPESTDHWVPFHKLSQWLTYSLLEAIEKGLNANFTGRESLTGLPEYRNGGLLVDLGLLSLKPDTMQRGIIRCREKKPELTGNELPMFESGDPAIVEWRALTVIYLDKIAEELRAVYKLDKETLTLAQVLEGGTWNAGRAIATEKRPSSDPPILIESDGTIF
ncbi:hypothetical protein INT43_000777, partial [Umbelopsis isabellina]